MHASVVMLVVLAWLARAEVVPIVRAGAGLVMPASVATAPLPLEPGPPADVPRPVRVAPPPPPLASGTVAAVPTEAPATVEPETGHEGGVAGSPDGVDGGIEGGVAGGVPGGVAGGSVSGGGGGAQIGPFRPGNGIAPPRKIKDVRPVYPPGALADQARGTVLIEAVVDTDGTIRDARVIQSIPGLDEAALDAVRQWEFVPSRLNGVPVAVIITVIVQFAIH